MLSEEEGASSGSPAGRRRARGRILQSPTSQNKQHRLVLASNDDQLERAQARAARAAASRRKSLASRALSDGPLAPAPDLFARDHVLQLLNNCIKLASENKINQRNTWELGLIDHLSEIIRVEAQDDDSETNFQKASCTLEAGVKIYSLRVDSTHSEAYKVLGCITRVGREDDKENISENDPNIVGQEDVVPRKEQTKKLSPLSTLESSFDSLNVKKFDAAFAIDPLYHQTSAQFDEGGAKGLLLSNLGVYGGCKVLFDSLETPGKSMDCDSEPEMSEFIDISFAKDQLEDMLNYIPRKKEISPTLKDIINQFNEDNQRPPNVYFEPIESVEQDGILETHDLGYEAETTEPLNGVNDDHASTMDGELSYTHDSFAGNEEENDDYSFSHTIANDNIEKIAGFLSLGIGLTWKVNAWAGPDHWKYQKARAPQHDPDPTSNSKAAIVKKSKKQDAPELEFLKSLDVQMPDIFLPPKNPKTLLLPANRVSCYKNITLPEDCHYQPESLVKLFLLPNVMCFGKNSRSFEEPKLHDTFDPVDAWDNEGTIDDDIINNENTAIDLGNLGDLVSQPRPIQKLDVKYDKFSKQVDVHALKSALWDRILIGACKSDVSGDSPVSFKEMFGRLRNATTGSQEGITPHLSLICLLHLANEHGLRICDHPTLDELLIYVPSSLMPREHHVM